MSESARIILELVERGWAELDQGEQAAFVAWVHSAQGVDLYMLLRHARRRWRRAPSSSSQTLAAVREVDSDVPTDRPPPGDDE